MGDSFPSVTANLLSAQTAKTVDERSILLIGCMVSGTASSGDLVEDLNTKAAFNDAFGRTSQVANAGRALIDALSISRKKPKIAAIGLTDNASGVAATGSFAFSGTATEKGTLTVYVDSIKYGKYTINVAKDDTATTIGAALATAIGNNSDSPVTAANSSGTVTLTAVNDGTQGNAIGIKIDGSVAGITTTLTAMNSGATNPSLTNLFDVIDSKRFTSIVYPEDWGVSTLTTETEARFNVDNEIIDGLGIVCEADTYSNLNTSLDALNQKTLAYICNKLISSSTHKGGAIFENPLVIAAQFAAYRELRLTVGANISSITTNGQAIGGTFFGGIPYHNTPFANLTAIESGNDFINTEATELTSSGGILLRNNPANTAVICNEAVTTYKTDALGGKDVTYKYVNYFDTLTLTREYVFNNLKSDLSQSILTTGDLIQGRPMQNAESITALIVSYYGILSGMNGENSYVLLRAGEAERKAFKKAIEDSIVVTLSTGTVTMESIANIVTQVRDITINFTPTFE